MLYACCLHTLGAWQWQYRKEGWLLQSSRITGLLPAKQLNVMIFYYFFLKHWILLFGGFSLHVLFMTDINPYLESRNLCKFCAVKDIHEIQLHSWVWSPALHSGTQWESERQQAEVEIKQIRLDIRRNFFLLGTTRQWSSCLEQPPALEGFKTWLDQTLSKLTWSHGWLWSEQEVGLKDFLTSLPTPVVLWS